MIYRKNVRHEHPVNFQLDLFTQGDGHSEYYSVATHMPQPILPGPRSSAGLRYPAEDSDELKSEFALDVVPNRHCSANSTDAHLPPRHAALRFLLVARAGDLSASTIDR